MTELSRCFINTEWDISYKSFKTQNLLLLAACDHIIINFDSVNQPLVEKFRSYFKRNNLKIIKYNITASLMYNFCESLYLIWDII